MDAFLSRRKQPLYVIAVTFKFFVRKRPNVFYRTTGLIRSFVRKKIDYCTVLVVRSAIVLVIVLVIVLAIVLVLVLVQFEL